MRAHISKTDRITKVLEAELNKPILDIYWGEDDRIVFEDGSSAYCTIDLTFDEGIHVAVIILDDEFDYVRTIEFDY